MIPSLDESDRYLPSPIRAIRATKRIPEQKHKHAAVPQTPTKTCIHHSHQEYIPYPTTASGLNGILGRVCCYNKNMNPRPGGNIRARVELET